MAYANAAQNDDEDIEIMKNSLVEAVFDTFNSSPGVSDHVRTRIRKTLDNLISELKSRYSRPTSDTFIINGHNEELTLALNQKYTELYKECPMSREGLVFETAQSLDSLSLHSNPSATTLPRSSSQSTSRSGSRPSSLYESVDSSRPIDSTEVADIARSYEMELDLVSNILNNLKSKTFESTAADHQTLREALHKTLKEMTTKEFNVKEQVQVTTSNMSDHPGSVAYSFRVESPIPSTSSTSHSTSPYEGTVVIESSHKFSFHKSVPAPNTNAVSEEFEMISKDQGKLQRLMDETARYEREAKRLEESRKEISPELLNNSVSDPLLKEYLMCLKEEEILRAEIEQLEQILVDAAK